jgi:CRISPR-associated protein Csx16
MTTYFVSRHPGAVAWAASQSFHVDALVSHLDLLQVHPGDTVIGTLPVNLVAQVCALGAAYWHLSLDLPAELRGRELSAANLTQLGAHVKHYFVELAEPVTPN